MNNYEHVINFDNDSYYKPKEIHDQLTAQKGDLWRWLLPKSVAMDIAPEMLSIGLVKTNYKETCSSEPSTKILYEIGKIRKQESENYVDFTLWVNSLPTETDYRQFALERENGQRLIGTFKAQETEKAAYMEALKAFYEGFPYTKVLCNVDGSKMRVRIWEKAGVFKLKDENLVVRLGETTVSNVNNPRLERINQGVFNYPSQDSYRVSVGSNIQEGNIFSLGNESYSARSGDTPQVILQNLKVNERILVNTGQSIPFEVKAGSRTIFNTNKVVVRAVFVETVSGNDRYRITFDGVIQAGNIFQVSATGKNTMSYTVLQGDTIATLEAFFNTVVVGSSRYYSVSAGVVPVVSFISGVQQINNTNNPSLQLFDLVNIPAYSVTKWVLLVGSDVQAGNIFVLNDQKYVATGEDTALTVANAFGFDSVSMKLETEVGEVPIAYALKGFAHDESNIADVIISEMPRLAISSQYVAEVNFRQEIDEGVYRLAVIDKSLEPVVLSLGNAVRVKSKAVGEIIEVSDVGDVFGYEYYESGLTQRLRLPIFVNPPKQVFTEEKVGLFMGGYRRTTTKIEHVSILVTQAGHLPFHITMANFLKHNTLRIANREYYCDGEYVENFLSSGTDLKQGIVNVIEVHREKNNYSRYRSTLYQSGSYGGFARLLFNGIFDLWLSGVNIARQITNGENILGSGSYQLTGETKDSINLKIYENGTLRNSINLPANQRFRLNYFLKLESGSLWTIEVELLNSDILETEIVYKCQSLETLEVSYSCQKINMPFYGQYNDDYGQDFNT